jgi:serine/threonine-protein kinase
MCLSYIGRDRCRFCEIHHATCGFFDPLAGREIPPLHAVVNGRLPTDPLADSPEPLLEGRPYRLIELIGRGGMGSVYVVEHRGLLKRFALKVPHKFYARRAFADRVRVEAQAIARLRHPNVVDVIDFWIADGHPCIIFELLKGRTLAKEIAERGSLPVGEAVDVTIQTLSALSAAHALGIVHRDIKPENLYLHNGRERRRILKVLDFGLARILPNALESAPAPPMFPTKTGASVGSPAYMSPEAARGERVGPAADIYSLGLVLYAMLVGHGPFDRGPMADPPSRYTAGIPGGLDAIVMRAIKEAPEARFASAGEFRDALEQVRSPKG